LSGEYAKIIEENFGSVYEPDTFKASTTLSSSISKTTLTKYPSRERGKKIEEIFAACFGILSKITMKKN
jgi:hypothetical protein